MLIGPCSSSIKPVIGLMGKPVEVVVGAPEIPAFAGGVMNPLWKRNPATFPYPRYPDKVNPKLTTVSGNDE